MNPLHLFYITNIRIMQDITNGRCGWCGTDELYVKYHDQEWGKLVTDDKTLFEFHLMYLQPIITQYFIDNKSEIWLLFLIAHSKR